MVVGPVFNLSWYGVAPSKLLLIKCVVNKRTVFKVANHLLFLIYMTSNVLFKTLYMKCKSLYYVFFCIVIFEACLIG